MRLWGLVAAHAGDADVGIGDVCAVAVAVTGAQWSSVVITLRAGGRETVYASAEVAARIEDLAQTVGEGPGVDASFGSAVVVADLSIPEWSTRWPAFAPPAALTGVRAMIALPMHVGGVRLGVLTLYRAAPGGLDREQLADALMLAGLATMILLDATDRAGAGLMPEPLGLRHPEIHQATGMITVQLGVTAAVALIRLRAHAFATGQLVSDVADDVVARRVRFTSDGEVEER